MQIHAGNSTALPRSILHSLDTYRHRVFIEKLGWEMNCEEGRERDQFDHHGTIYVVATNDDQEIIGCARLLPTTQPYLLGDVFPQLMGAVPVPRSPEVWELSRFAAVDFSGTSSHPLEQFSSPVAVGLLEAAIEVASSKGAQRLVTVSPVGVERLLRRAGFAAHRAAPPVNVDGHKLYACWIEIGLRQNQRITALN